jgi:hypothetical protein
MTLQVKDFIPKITSHGSWVKLQKYSPVSEMLPRMNQWMTQHRIEVLNIETIRLLAISHPDNRQSNVNVGEYELIRVWYSASATSDSLLSNQQEDNLDSFRPFHDLDKVAFPIITLTAQTIETVASAQEFRKCSRRAFQDEYFTDLQLFDSANQRFIVESYHKELELGEIDGIETVAVSFELNESKSIDLNGVKQAIASRLADQSDQRALRSVENFHSLCQFITTLNPD